MGCRKGLRVSEVGEGGREGGREVGRLIRMR